MIKKLLTLIIIFISILQINVISQGIKFNEDKSLYQLMLKADSAKKLIFLDCYTVWCGPCKYLSREIFPQKEVGDFFNEHFIAGKFDMEKGEGIEMAKTYEIKAYPTLLFLNSKGEIEHMAVGSMDGPSLIKVAQKALDKENNYKALLNKMKKGLTLDLLNQYLETNPYGTDRDSLITVYFNGLSTSEKLTVKNWDLIYNSIEDYKNPIFKFVLNNEAEYKKVGGYKVDQKILSVIINYLSTNSRDEEKKAKAEAEIKSLNHPMAARAFKYQEFIALYRSAKSDFNETNWKAFATNATSYLANSNDPSELNQIAWFVFENYKKANDLATLKTAKDWAWKSIQLEKGPQNLDTYANIIFDLGNTADAVKYEEEAITIAKANGYDSMVPSLQDQLNIFKAKK